MAVLICKLINVEVDTLSSAKFLRSSTEGADGLMQSYMKMCNCWWCRSSSLIECYRNYLQILFLWTLAWGFHWMCVRKRNASIFYVKCQNQDSVGRRRQDTYDVVGYLNRRSLLLFRLSQCVVRSKNRISIYDGLSRNVRFCLS